MVFNKYLKLWMSQFCSNIVSQSWLCTMFFFLLRELNIKAPTHRPDSNQQPTALIRPPCCLLSDPFGRKVALKHTSSTAANYTVACTFCACARLSGASLMPVMQNRKTGNEGTECIEKQSAHHEAVHAEFRPSHTPRWFTSTPPIRVSNILRLRKLNRSRRCPRGPKSFQRSRTHRTDLILNSSESPQMLQMAWCVSAFTFTDHSTSNLTDLSVITY